LAFGGFERESFVGNDAASGKSLAFGEDGSGVASPSFFWFRLDLDLVDLLVDDDSVSCRSLAFGGFERESFVGNGAASGRSLAFGEDEIRLGVSILLLVLS
jgi:hypothetical protein